MIEVEVAVHDDRDVVWRNAEGGQTLRDAVRVFHLHGEAALRSERRVRACDVHRMQARVEEDVALGRPQERRPHRCGHPRFARRALEPRGERGARDVDGAGAEHREFEHSSRVMMNV